MAPRPGCGLQLVHLGDSSASGRRSRPWTPSPAAGYVDRTGLGAAAFEVIAAVWSSVDQLAHAYAAGEGVGWHDHDSRLFTGVDRFDRTSPIAEWLPAVDGLVDRLRSGIRVLDVGCGLGSATILMAEACAVRAGRRDVVRRHPRPRVPLRRGARPGRRGRCAGTPAASWHEVGRPSRSEPYADDRPEKNLANPVAEVFYAAISCLCVPTSSSQGGAALGAQAGPAGLVVAFDDAGFAARIAASTRYNLVIEARA